MTVHTDLSSRSDVRQRDGAVRDVVRFGLGVVLLGMAFLFAATVWVSTCNGATADSLACGAPSRTLLALAAPGVLLVGGLWGFVRAHQNRDRHDAWLAWQSAAWLLLTLMLAALVMSLPPLAGPSFF